MIAMNLASITMVALENPPKAALISAIPKITSRRQANRGGAPNGSLSIMIRTTMSAVIAKAIIIWVVICFSSSYLIVASYPMQSVLQSAQSGMAFICINYIRC